MPTRRAQDGMVRIALATGDTAAAITYARLHDLGQSTRGIPESAPLLPRVFRSLGRNDEARTELETARSVALRRGQVAAWASLTLELAQLALSSGDARSATALADSASDAARRVAASDVQFRARATATLARARDRTQSDATLRAVDDVARAADRMSDPQLRAEVRSGFGAALAARGRWREALAQYRLAGGAPGTGAGRPAPPPAPQRGRGGAGGGGGSGGGA